MPAFMCMVGSLHAPAQSGITATWLVQTLTVDVSAHIHWCRIIVKIRLCERLSSAMMGLIILLAYVLACVTLVLAVWISRSIDLHMRPVTLVGILVQEDMEEKLLYQNSVNLWRARLLLYISYFTALHALGSWLAVNTTCCCWGDFYEKKTWQNWGKKGNK